MHPKEKNAFLAFEMFSARAFVEHKSGVHHTPRHLEAVDGFKSVEHTLTWAFSGMLPCE